VSLLLSDCVTGKAGISECYLSGGGGVLNGVVSGNLKLVTVAGRMRLRRNCLSRRTQAKAIVNGRMPREAGQLSTTGIHVAGTQLKRTTLATQPLFPGAANAANHGHNHNYIRSDNVEKQFEREASQLQFELTMEPRKIASFRRSYFIFISESDTHGVLRCYGSGIKQ